MGRGRGAVAAWELTLTCRCSRKCCSRQALRPSARTRSWPRGDLIHGLRCWGRRGLYAGAGWGDSPGSRSPWGMGRSASLPGDPSRL